DYVDVNGELINDAGRRAELDGRERILCLDASTGDVLWEHAYDCPYNLSYPGGPRATPTIDEGRVYTMGAEGHLHCLNLHTGEVIWSKHLNEAYGVQTPFWGYAAAPLVDGERLFVPVGGPGTGIVALNKATGEEMWRALDTEEPGYSPPVIIQVGDNRQLVQWTPLTLNGLDLETGEVYWSVPLEPSYGMSIMAPRQSGDLIFASGIGYVGAAFRLAEDGRS